MPCPETSPLKVISEKQAAALLSLSAVQLRRMRYAGSAPRHVRLSDRRIGYREVDIETWQQERLSADANDAPHRTVSSVVAGNEHMPPGER